MNTREQITDRLQQMNRDAKELGRNVWLAGLGTVGMADQASRDLWTRLIEQGKKVEVGVDELPKGDLLRSVRDAGVRVNDRLTETRERVERGVEENMAGVLHRFGAPSRRDVQDLIDRVDKLTRKVENL
ncbi:MAG: phasin family protein [Thermoanaerobaculia bacterium]|nr:phasin family protein [Thermoanaerobaculia bacterium]